MVGFYKPKLKIASKSFHFRFQKKLPLKKNMSDIMGGKCTMNFNGTKERKIGFTMRVGGARSGALDRRNWDTYIVNKKAKRITSKQGLELMGFPRTFKFPVSENEALKQLGNSVAVNVIKEIGKNLKYHINTYLK